MQLAYNKNQHQVYHIF